MLGNYIDFSDFHVNANLSFNFMTGLETSLCQVITGNG
jgi:hypothetical protein